MKRQMLNFVLLLILCHQSLIAQAQEDGRNPFQRPPQVTSVSTGTAKVAMTSNLPQQAVLTLTRAYPLSYTNATEVSETLKELGFARLSIAKNTNSVILQGSEAEHRRAQEILRALDIATKQVTLEAKVIALSQEHNKSIGINWNWDSVPQNNSIDTDDSDSTDGSSATYGGNFQFWRSYAFRFNATLNALISNGRAKILAKPRIITIPGREASIFIGDHIPVQTEKHDSSGSYTATEYVDAGIKLQYTPLISQDGKMVTAKVHTEVSTPVLISELKNYRITSRTADTNVRMFSGETLMIGGLINEEEQNNLQKIPLLGDLPLLGQLFRNRTKKKSKVEVILLLTPHVTEAGSSPAIYTAPEE